MNKKVVVITVIIIVVLVVVGVSGYFYFFHYAAKKTAADSSVVPAEINGLVTHPGEDGGSYTICEYECGDGICETADTACAPGSSTCICPETPQSCPQDCK